ncbi:cell wall-associated NlpC family hydrolase [Actinoplanes lutulentus]|uniref:NlpC/P60 family protein n=1 Tax=Actinoplanes lutulentus TaxID=1287878 RepID=A0A327ZFR6_9ACTN|nr:NlpC/P60 family protein [Actinoplanes lutulentus]MBB2941618.1 cell wall-associated NlpC family hydrolase [Actinoplanes lutulentus]RAK39538.1 NlpC/P60 family protein [Actinoplanes lutulentus]
MHELRSRHGRRNSSRAAGTVALSLGLCLCAGQLVTASPAAAASTTPVIKVASTTTASAAAATVTPRLSAKANTRNLKWGSTLKVTAKVIDPRTGKIAKGTVRLQGYVGGKWRTWDTESVKNQNGTVTLKYAPKNTYKVRTIFNGSGYKTVTTVKTTVKVKASGAKILAEAKKHKGALYKYGASGPKRFDCSGFTKYVYKKAAGKSLPHKANSQQSYGKKVAKSNKKIGDLIVFRNGSYGYHAGIYAGNGYVYDSPHTGARVGKHKIWNSNYVVRRLVA